jgi:DNA-binding beta-propeller fold protein YncE
VATAPSIKIKPVDEKTSKGIARAVGCGVGCVVVGIVMFFLLTVVLPMAGGLAGVVVGLKPDLVLTAMPMVPGLVGSGYGTKELSFGGEGTGPGLFSDARAISVDPASGKIYVADYEGGRVQEFDAQGKFITQWVVDGKKPIISSLAADRKGNVYVAASGKLLRYTSDGKLDGEVKVEGFDRFDNIVLAADGSLVGVNGEDVVHFAADGKILGQIPAAISTVTGDSELDAKVAVDGQGNIYLLGTFSNAVFKFDSKGKYVNRFGSNGDQPGQFRAAYAIATDGKGRIYVSDTKGVQVFSNDGRYINVISVEYFAYGLAFDDQGKLYVTTNQKKVDKYSIPE